MILATVAILALALAATPLRAAPARRRRCEGRANRQGVRAWAARILRRSPKKKGGEADLGVLVAETATRLRAGARPEDAWNLTLRRAGMPGGGELDAHGVPPALRELARPRRFRRGGAAGPALAGAVAACRLSYGAGAPMADVLDACAEGITESAEAASARDVALAGPQTSAQMIAWMPIAGVVMGSALGAEPLGFLFGTWAGRGVLVLAAALEIAGIVWLRRLAAKAAAAVG